MATLTRLARLSVSPVCCLPDFVPAFLSLLDSVPYSRPNDTVEDIEENRGQNHSQDYRVKRGSIHALEPTGWA